LDARAALVTRILTEVRSYYRLDSDIKARWTKLGRIQGLLDAGRILGYWSRDDL
jgi:hypothetical protein